MRALTPRVVSYSYARMGYANPHAVTGIGYTGGATTTYVYDSNGNLTSDGTYTYAWDYQNRLTKVGNVSGTITYAYDHMGNRVKKVEGEVTTLYPNKLYNVTTESTPTATKHIYANEILVAIAETAGSSSGAITLDSTSTSISTGYSTSTYKTGTHTVSGSNPVIVLTADIFQDIAGIGKRSRRHHQQEPAPSPQRCGISLLRRLAQRQ
jgi:YD repeat-containing protein